MKSILIDLKQLVIKDWMARTAFVLFLVISIWWLTIHPLDAESFIERKHIWTSTYGLLSIIGGLFGLVISHYWGGYKSLLGRAIGAFSLGLLLQFFGQTIYNYYTLVAKIEAPYPSLGDIGYFGSIPAYIYGAWLLGRVSGVRISLKSYGAQIFAILLPLLMLASTYFIFLQHYQFDWSAPLSIFLDFGYPLGQAIYVSIALLVFIVSRKTLGGMMRKPVSLFLVALIVQYICDFNFLYEANHEVWYAGGPGDYLYAVSYLVMTIGIIYIGSTFHKIRET